MKPQNNPKPGSTWNQLSNAPENLPNRRARFIEATPDLSEELASNSRFPAINSILFAVLLSFVLCLLPLSAASAHITTTKNEHITGQLAAAKNGRITGRLLDGTNKNAPLSGQTVTLQMAQGVNSQDLTTAKTDAQGNFSFANLSTDKTISYAIYIRYQGAQYTSNLISLATQPQQKVNLTVYDATTDSSKVAVVDATVLVRDPSSHSGTFTISEIYDFKNLNTHAYVGSLDASKGKPNALLFPLPTGAHNVDLNSGFDGYHTIQVNDGFATDAALFPGDTTFAFSFDVPYSGSTYNFSYTPLYPTVSLTVLVPPDLHVNAHGLSSQGIITADDQHQYQSFKASTLPSRQAVQLDFAGLTAPQSATPSTPLNLNTLWLIVGLLIMIAILFVTAFIYRFQQRKLAHSRHARNGKGHPTHEKKPSSSPKASRRAEDKKDELLRELLELDKEFEASKISKTAYQEQRGKVKARLRSLMSEQEASRK
jgi:5-hydroxyisourate hydrolase-like protein (transthyretin family)